MNIDKLADIINMSGYAVYVWTSFGVTLFILIALALLIKRKLKKVLLQNKEINQQLQ